MILDVVLVILHEERLLGEELGANHPTTFGRERHLAHLLYARGDVAGHLGAAHEDGLIREDAVHEVAAAEVGALEEHVKHFLSGRYHHASLPSRLREAYDSTDCEHLFDLLHPGGAMRARPRAGVEPWDRLNHASSRSQALGHLSLEPGEPRACGGDKHGRQHVCRLEGARPDDVDSHAEDEG